MVNEVIELLIGSESVRLGRLELFILADSLGIELGEDSPGGAS